LKTVAELWHFVNYSAVAYSFLDLLMLLIYCLSVTKFSNLV